MQSSQKDPAPPAIRVLTYNIHHANPPSKPDVIDIDAIAKTIAGQQPDLVALQEIDANTTRSGVALHEAEYLGEKLGMKVYFGKGIDYGGGAYGVAILSKWPIANMKKYELPTVAGTKGEPRVLTTAEVSVPGGKKIVFACTHLDAQRTDTNRIVQMKRVLEIMSTMQLPVIIAGDLNAVPESQAIAMLDQHFTRSCVTDCGFTIPQVNPRKTIDYIAFRPAGAFRIAAHEVIQEPYASDHLPVRAVFTQTR